MAATGAAAFVEIDIADVTLARNDLAGIAGAIALSRATLSKIRRRTCSSSSGFKAP